MFPHTLCHYKKNIHFSNPLIPRVSLNSNIALLSTPRALSTVTYLSECTPITFFLLIIYPLLATFSAWLWNPINLPAPPLYLFFNVITIVCAKYVTSSRWPVIISPFDMLVNHYNQRHYSFLYNTFRFNELLLSIYYLPKITLYWDNKLSTSYISCGSPHLISRVLPCPFIISVSMRHGKDSFCKHQKNHI